MKRVNRFKPKRLIAVILVVALIFPNISNVYGHDREEHDDDIEYVLFGDREYKPTHPKHQKIIQAIEDATYLCVDQFNGSGEKELANLKAEKIPDIPQAISEFDFTSNYAHRNFTHRGWNVNYSEKAHWPVRKKILYNTVDYEFFSVTKTPISWFPWLNTKIYGENNYKQQCESFCELLYYIHIIGDHIEAKRYDALAYVDPLTSLNDRDNPGIIPDLIDCCDVLFVDQKNTYTYKEFRQELEALRDKSNKLTNSKGGVNTEEKFNEYHQCALDLLDLMALYIPKLLKKERFFAESLNI